MSNKPKVFGKFEPFAYVYKYNHLTRTEYYDNLYDMLAHKIFVESEEFIEDYMLTQVEE